MAEYVDFTLTFTDNSSGDRDESGTQVQIYTDSPSYKPTEKIDYSAARHAWMALPLINAGVTTLPIRLKSPVTFIVVRMRQFNANGYGEWNIPGGSAGMLFSFSPVTGAATPNSPSNIGLIITGTPTPPVDPPVDPPPDPPPVTGGGTSSNYVFETQFSGVQGQNQWSYKDATGTNMTYSAPNSLWNGSQTYMGIWSGGWHPGSSIGAMLRFTVPSTGVIDIAGTTQLYDRTGNTGVTVTLKQNASTLKTWSLTTTDVTALSAVETTAVAVTAGDTIDFILTPIGSITNNSTSMKPTIQLTTDGTTPTNPTVSLISPSSVDLSIGGVTSVLVSLSSAPASAATIALSSNATGVATVPASVVIPAGQLSQTIVITGVAAGAAIITASYSGSSKTCNVSVIAPVSSSWTNAPAGGTVIKDHNFTSLIGLLDVYSSTILTTDVTAPFSPPTVAKARLEAFNLTGGNQLEYTTSVFYREMYFGLYWRTNPQFQGRTAGNKLFFLKGTGGVTNGVFLFGNSQLVNGTAPLVFIPNTSGLSNAHILGTSDPGASFTPNVGNGTLSVGVWYKIEAYIKSSTSRTSRDGILKWWINGVLVGSYLNINYCGANGEGLNQWLQTQTWDGAFDMGTVNTVAWEHYLDHLYIVGKN